MNVRSQRGSALLLAIVVVFIITLIGVATIRFSARELAGATSARQSEALVSCAEAGRQLFLSQFRSLGVAPTSLQLLNVPIDNAAGTARVVGGHVDQNVQVSQVTVLPSSTFGVQQNTVRDLTNIVTGGAQLGGTAYRVVVHCQDGGSASDPTSGRQLEVEFGLRFGL
jgi:hypothetical protein